MNDDKERAYYATYCPECQAMFFDGDEGFDYENCLECGSDAVYEVPA